MVNLTRKLTAIHSHAASQGLDGQISCSSRGSQDTLYLGRTTVYMSHKVLLLRGQNENCLKVRDLKTGRD
jgi:hypothetical protein